MLDGRKFIVEIFDTYVGQPLQMTAEVVGTMSGYGGSGDIVQVLYDDGAVKDLTIPSFEMQIVEEII